MTEKKKLTTAGGAPVPDNQNAMTAGPRGPMLLQGVWFLEKDSLLARRGRRESLGISLGDLPK